MAATTQLNSSSWHLYHQEGLQLDTNSFPSEVKIFVGKPKLANQIRHLEDKVVHICDKIRNVSLVKNIEKIQTCILIQGGINPLWKEYRPLGIVSIESYLILLNFSFVLMKSKLK